MNIANHTGCFKLTLLATIISFAFTLPSQANMLDDVANAIKKSKTKVNFRYRLEGVDQDSKDDDAVASTLRSRLTWTSAKTNNLSVTAEIDNVAEIGDDNYNSTANGRTQYPVVADPKGTDLNQLNIQYQSQELALTLGRQRINHNNQRFVGGVAWRQNEQTFDGVRMQYTATPAWTLDYSYVKTVNRIFGPDDGANKAELDGDFHLFNTTYAINKKHRFNGFAYLLDNETSITSASTTVGIDYHGDFGVVAVNASYASQSDAGDNPNNYTADYYKAELIGKLGQFKLKTGIEVLGSDDGVAFSTPLATLHMYQGFADIFLNTPANGIEDTYISASTSLAGINLSAIYHNFSADEGNDDYGTEIDLVASYKFNKYASGLLKLAAYDADDYQTDTSKAWAMVTLAF